MQLDSLAFFGWVGWSLRQVAAEALSSDHLGNSKKVVQLVAYENELS